MFLYFFLTERKSEDCEQARDRQTGCLVNRQEIVKPVLFGTPGEVIEIIDDMRKLLRIKAIKKNTRNGQVNQRLRLLFTSATLPIGVISHSLRKIYANWAYAIHGRIRNVAEYAYICEILGQNYNPLSAASYSYLQLK